MLYKEDWDQARQRYLAWWNTDAVDRCGIKVTARRSDVKPKEIPSPETPLEMFTDPDYVIPAAEERFRRTYFGGEAFPSLLVNLGPGSLASYLGTKPTFKWDTVWQEPWVKDWDDFLIEEPDENNRWWRLTCDLTAAACAAGRDKYFVAISDLGGPTDVLSHLRENSRLCTDMIERSTQVLKARDKALQYWYNYYDALHFIIQKTHDGSTAWINLWSPGRSYALQCDFSCMISPKMFEKFVLPELYAQSKWLDHSIYHLDGPGALQHLDAILTIPDLHAVQWVPGAGQPGHDEWIPILQKIQKAGKSIIVYGPPDKLELFLSELSPRGLMYETRTNTVEEAEQLIKLAKKLSKDRK